VHVALLVGVRNRISVMLDWFWLYLTSRTGTRLITGGNPDETARGVGAATAAGVPLQSGSGSPILYPVSR
jgi:hypothetical protein